jgi:hypothetical protein
MWQSGILARQIVRKTGPGHVSCYATIDGESMLPSESPISCSCSIPVCIKEHHHRIIHIQKVVCPGVRQKSYHWNQAWVEAHDVQCFQVAHKLIVSHSHSWLLPCGPPAMPCMPELSKPPCMTEAMVVAPALDMLAACDRVTGA